MAGRCLVAVRRPIVITDSVRDLYVAHWGAPPRNARFNVEGLDVEVFKWTAETNPQGVNLYATIGASARPMAGCDENHRVKFFTGLLPPKDDIASALAALALYPVRENVAVDHGHTVPAGVSLWRGTEMRRFLVVRTPDDVIARLDLADGLHVDFLQAIPIFDSEFVVQARARRGGALTSLGRVWRCILGSESLGVSSSVNRASERARVPGCRWSMASGAHPTSRFSAS